MKELPLLLITVGAVFVIIGLFWYFGSKFLPLSRLPGDIVIEKENFKFYFPLATSIIISLILTLIFWLWYLAKR